MNCNRLLLITIFLIKSVFIFGQQTIQLVDKESKAPIPYAHIFLKQARKGTVSNGNGFFYINYSKFKNDTLIISCIGYKSAKIPVIYNKEIASVFELELSLTELNEVSINEKGFDAKEILQKAIDRYYTNYGFYPYDMSTFMRTTIQKDNEYIYLFEADGFVHTEGAPSWEKMEKYVPYHEFTTHTQIRFSDYKYKPYGLYYNPVHPLSTSLLWNTLYYYFSIEDIIQEENGELLFVIRGKPLNERKLKKRYGWSSVDFKFHLMDVVMTIRESDYAVLEVRKEKLYDTNKKVTFSGKTKFFNKAEILVKYDKIDETYYRPYYLKRTYEYTDTGFSDLPIKPTKIQEEHEFFFTEYDTKQKSINELKEIYYSYRPFLTNQAVYLKNIDGKIVTSRVLLKGAESYFQLNFGYTMRGLASYEPEYWTERENSLPPYKNKEKLFTDLAKVRPLSEQFADFHYRRDSLVNRMLEIYKNEPFTKRILEKEAKFLEGINDLFDARVDY